MARPRDGPAPASSCEADPRASIASSDDAAAAATSFYPAATSAAPASKDDAAGQARKPLVPFFSDVEGDFRRRFGDLFRSRFGISPGGGPPADAERVPDVEHGKDDSSRRPASARPRGGNPACPAAQASERNQLPKEPMMRAIEEEFPPWDGVDGGAADEDQPGNRLSPLDEVCFHYCSQTKDGRQWGIPPSCRMICLRRKDKRPGTPWWNILDGYYVYTSASTEASQDHITGMQYPDFNAPMPMPSGRRAPSLPHDPDGELASERETDLGVEFQDRTERVVGFYKRSFAPALNTLRRWPSSFSDGTQTEFFRRFADTVKRGDPFVLARNSFKKLWNSLTRNNKEE